MTPAGNITPRPANLTTMPPCLDCGTPSTSTRCTRCTRQRERRRGSSTARGYTSQWQRTARQHYGQPCHWCGRPADTADHLVPKAKGGTDDEANIVPACRSCNSSRRDRGAPPTRNDRSPSPDPAPPTRTPPRVSR